MAKLSGIRPERSQREGAQNDPRLDWWREAKFGLFIHWGLYAIPAGVWRGKEVPGIGEWIMLHARIPVREYEQLAAQFSPTRYDAREWVALAKAAGQKYIVITSKHHEGFCLFDSRVTDYDVMGASPFGRDILAELADECARQGIRLGFYYSQTQDWHHPDGDGNDWDYDESQKDFAGYIEDYVKPQVTELLTNYGPVGLIWFDTPKGITAEQSRSLLELVHTLQPDCLVCGRVGNALGDYASAGDNMIPDVQMQVDFETPATINDTWGFKLNDHNWKSTEQLIRHLVDIVSKGGNYLLNVGPTADGVIPEPSVERLRGMGRWLEVNAEAIYGTRPGPIQGQAWCRTTAKDGVIYLHVLDWPADGVLTLRGLECTPSAAYLLSDPSQAALPLQCQGELVTITGPTVAPDPAASVVVLKA
jgi:alpha-L-fucosidase